MAESIFQLTAAGLFLGLGPQLVSWLVASWALRRGSWWPAVVSVPLAGLCFVAVAQGLYSPDSTSFLQGGDTGGGRIVVDRIEAGALVHTGVALVLQLSRLIRG